MIKPTHWTVNTSDIVAHLFYSVWSTQEVVVTTSAGELRGALLQPERAEVGIAVIGAVPPLLPGSPVCVEYAGAADSYRFYTELIRATPGRLYTALPYAVEHADRRILPRFPLPPGSGFFCQLPDKPPFPLQDISTGGISFFDRHDSGLRAGSVVTAELVLPGEEPMPVDLEIRQMHLRRAQLLIGARIAAISLRNRARLAWFLSSWKTRAAA